MRASWIWIPTLGAALAGGACKGKKAPESVGEVRALRVAAVTLQPGDAAWQKAPVHRARLLPQDMVEPRLLEPSTPELSVQAIEDGQRVAFRIAWADPTKNELPGAGIFSDAVAVQLPARVEADVPAPQMGEPGKPVEITFWSANMQSKVDGRPDDIHALYPNAKVDHYPFEAASLTAGSPEQVAMAHRYRPAEALGNPGAIARTRPVQELKAEGPGTLGPAGVAVDADGRGTHDGKAWSVVVARTLPEGVGGAARGQVAFAVWQGEKKEVGARKMRTIWIPLSIGGAP